MKNIKASISTIISQLDKNKEYIFLEIGSYLGDSAEFILENYQVKKYTIIDPYEGYEEGDGFYKVFNMKNKDIVLDKVKKRLSKYPVEFIRKYSDNAHNLIEDKSIDVCFIDGNHTYNYVYNDIKNYINKVKNGGIICGDDYFMRNKKNIDNIKYPNAPIIGYEENMVYEAVQEYFKNTKYEIKEFGIHRGYPKTWLVIK